MPQVKIPTIGLPKTWVPAGTIEGAHGDSPPEPTPNGWNYAGNGYCEDRNTKEEFRSLHAKPKRLQECADAGLSDPAAIAFDFTREDGGCDIRYSADALAQDIPGYEWFGGGYGKGDPQASGKRKHDLLTFCYVRTIMPTTTALAVGKAPLNARLHPYLRALIREYSFKPVRTQHGDYVNIVLVRSPMSQDEEVMYHKYQDELLFIGIMSLEDYPLPPPNPFSGKWEPTKFTHMFPGWLNMYRNPEKIFPSHVKVHEASQSDFFLPGAMPALPKKWDFTFSASDQDIGKDYESECVGWSMFAKNWSFAREALEVMCGELGMTGVIVASRDKEDKRRCKIPAVCEGKLVQTTYIPQETFFDYVRQSRFLFLPQVHDASPRVATQALSLNVPLLMNRNLIGGWKYLTEKTGEFFNDLGDIRESIKRLQQNVDAGVYEPRKWITEHYGDENSGVKFKNWIEENFKDRVKLPDHTRLLVPLS